MLGYYDPDSLRLQKTDGVISFINAADVTDIREVQITTGKDARRIIGALKDQIKHDLAGLNGRVRKVQGIFTHLPDSPGDGVIADTDTNQQTPVRMEFDTAPEDIPDRGICIAIGEMVDGALMAWQMIVDPLAPMPAPTSSPAPAPAPISTPTQVSQQQELQSP